EAESRTFPARFIEAIPVGADCTMVWPHFAVWLLTDPTNGVLRLTNQSETRQVVERVAHLYTRRIAGDEPSVTEWRTATADAYAAATATATAVADADAYTAATAAAAATAVAYTATRQRQCETLLRLLRDAPVLPTSEGDGVASGALVAMTAGR
ncbi:MAG: hypothetical protein M3Y58_23570, partial [Chloroflexota bacterium]|nr:hypothetical protein [Chloroflexota bacterium]